MRTHSLVLSILLVALMSLAALAANLTDTTTVLYFTEGASPSGLALTKDLSNKATGWGPVRTLTTDKAITFYTPAMTGDIAGGMWTVNLWAKRQKTATTLRVEVLKTDSKGGNEVKLGSVDKSLNYNFNAHDLTNFTVKVEKAPMKDELIALRISKVTGDDVELGFNGNDYDSTFVMVGSTPYAQPAGGLMTFHFRNCTNKYTDDQLSWTQDGRTWHKLSDGLVVPASSKAAGRMYMRIQAPATATEPALDKRDFVEYNLSVNAKGQPNIYINTTTVDELQVPLTIEVMDTAGNARKAGISEAMPTLMDEFKKEVPTEFLSCLMDGKIVSAGGAGFRQGGPSADYFKKYVDDVWAMYATPTKTPGGWTGHVEGTALIFIGPNGEKKSCASKPNTQDIVAGPGGTGVLNANPDFCGCCNRGVLEDPADWTNVDKFYQKSPSNFYAKFMHEHAINSKAYGFSYDDAQQQDTLIAAVNGYAAELTVSVYWAPSEVVAPHVLSTPIVKQP
jgi:hypothetical protein